MGEFVDGVRLRCVMSVNTGADAEMNRQGIEAVKSVLKEARKIARTLPPEKRAAIEEMCNEIEALMQELADLQARGLVREGGNWEFVILKQH